MAKSVSSLHAAVGPGSSPLYFRLREIRLKVSEFQNTIDMVSTSHIKICNTENSRLYALGQNYFWHLQGAANRTQDKRLDR